MVDSHTVPSRLSRIDRLIAKIRSKHQVHPPASPRSLQRLRRLGFPEDALEFYKVTDGALLHSSSKYGGLGPAPERRWKWEILSCQNIEPVSDSYVDPESPLFKRTESWMHIVNVQDGDYLALKVEKGHVGEILDCFHETVGQPGWTKIVAMSFTELLEKLLASSRPFWLSRKKKVYGTY